MTVLHLGVIDLPYVEAPPTPKKPMAQAKRGKANKPKKAAQSSAGTETTGDVATWLENKYGIMQAFADRHLPEIADSLAGSMAGALESLMMGAPAENNPFGTATSEITQKFKAFLDNREMDGATGVPTKAAQDGVNRRLKIKKGPPRPSFIDTGEYQASATSWVD